MLEKPEDQTFKGVPTKAGLRPRRPDPEFNAEAILQARHDLEDPPISGLERQG